MRGWEIKIKSEWEEEMHNADRNNEQEKRERRKTGPGILAMGRVRQRGVNGEATGEAYRERRRGGGGGGQRGIVKYMCG